MNLLSIIIPIYNGADKVTNCLNSIYQQGLDEETFEVLCVDDCSTDTTVQVVTNYANNHQNLILLSNKVNKRAGGARNTGIKCSKGKYIVFLDHDDEIGSLTDLVNYISCNEVDVMMCDYMSINTDGKVRRKYHHIEQNIAFMKMNGEQFLKSQQISWAPWCYCVRKEYLVSRNLYFAENVFFEDTDWSIKCLISAEYIVFLPIVLIHYYLYPIQMTKVKNDIKKIDQNFYLSERIRMVAQSVSNEDIKKIILGHYYYHYKCSIFRFWWRLKYQERIQLLRKYPIYLEKGYKDVFLVFVSCYPLMFNILILFVKPGLHLAYRTKQLVKRSY